MKGFPVSGNVHCGKPRITSRQYGRQNAKTMKLMMVMMTTMMMTVMIMMAMVATNFEYFSIFYTHFPRVYFSVLKAFASKLD